MILLIIIALISGGLGAAGCVYFFINAKKGASSGKELFVEEVARRTAFLERLQTIEQGMIEKQLLQKAGKALLAVKDSLKTERGRITITQAELETVEARLRELEEIERELQASGLDTQEEINILEKKRDELKAKNETLRTQLTEFAPKLEKSIVDLPLPADVQTQVVQVQEQIKETDTKLEQLLGQITLSTEQYVVLKKRYDALDIEYAQLYEKYTALEAARNKENKKGH